MEQKIVTNSVYLVTWIPHTGTVSIAECIVSFCFQENVSKIYIASLMMNM